jgi:hypothetical protein
MIPSKTAKIQTGTSRTQVECYRHTGLLTASLVLDTTLDYLRRNSMESLIKPEADKTEMHNWKMRVQLLKAAGVKMAVF